MFRRMMLIALMLCVPAGVRAQGNERAAYIRENYAKFEYRIPMRDGVKLFTAVYVPNDRSKPYPFLMTRTPYSVGPYGADRYKTRLAQYEAFEKEGFIFVFQDVRGKYMSEGTFVNMRPYNPDKKGDRDTDESTDTYDTIEWLLHNVGNNNGRVGLWGISYPGFYSSSGMIDSHPALKAVSPQAPIADWFWDDVHHHGAFILPLAFNFFSSFGKARKAPTTESAKRFDHKTDDGYQFFLNLGPLKNANERYFHGDIDFWNKLTEHPDYDKFWQSRNILPHLKHITAAVLIVGGWFDTEDLYGALYTYRAVEKNNPGIFNSIVMGPWFHGGWARSSGRKLGDADFGFKTAETYRKRVALPFFKHYLKEEDGSFDFPEAMVFETGADRWRNFEAWPPRAAEKKSLYLRAGGGLSFEAPDNGKDAFDAYISDPNKPVPYTTEITTRWARNYMAEDQRFAAWRPDVRVYTSDTLKEDMTVAGPMRADLYVSTTGTDADWIVKVIDVNPDKTPDGRGAQQTLVRAEVFRGRFRKSYEKPVPFKPGEVTEVAFRLNDILHTFKRDHRLMVQIQSTWFPFVDRNPQKYVPNIFKANEDDFITVTNRVYHTKRYPSRLEIGVLP